MHYQKRYSSKIPIILAAFLLFYISALSQTGEKPFIKLTNPLLERNNISSSRQFMIGSTCKTCTLMINGERVKVYVTGSFAYELNLLAGDSAFTIVAISGEGKSASKRIHFNYIIPKPAEPVKTVGIESIRTFPEGDLLLMATDKIQFRVKAFPGSTVTTINGTVLYELPISQTKGMPGIYQGTYEIKKPIAFQHLKYL